MTVPLWVWLATAGVAIAFLLFDVFIVGRRPHEPSMGEAGRALAGYIGAAVVFGLGVWHFAGVQYAGEFFAGWITEYSLSVDNLFVFILIMASFAVPRQYQQTALLVGIVLALVLRGIFIGVGAAIIEQFTPVFYLFGAFLIYTAAKLLGGDDDEEYTENAVMRFARKHLRTTDDYHGTAPWVRINGKRYVTPMLLVFVALGTTDLLFALDSIPAIYGLTQEPYLVLMANVFALMGLRQLYFLLGGLLQKLVFLSYGLAFLLAFIGVKLILHALHVNDVPWINGGQPVAWAPEVPISWSLGIILCTLVITAAASLAWTRHRAE